jgi:hypothetical protein
MNISETIYQHVKSMLMANAIEVLHFVEFLETKPDVIASNAAENNLLEFMQNLPVGKRTDAEINIDFQALSHQVVFQRPSAATFSCGLWGI